MEEKDNESIVYDLNLIHGTSQDMLEIHAKILVCHNSKVHTRHLT